MNARAKGKLKDEHRAFITRRLAMYDTPKEAAEALNQEFGISISPQGAERYDPTKRAGQYMGERWRKMFHETRQDFLNNVDRYVPEANKTVRISLLANSARAMRARGNHVGAADMLERIAKEMGNVHTNRRELTGKDGGALKVEYADLTDEEINARLVQLVGMTEKAGDAGDA